MTIFLLKKALEANFQIRDNKFINYIFLIKKFSNIVFKFNFNLIKLFTKFFIVKIFLFFIKCKLNVENSKFIFNTAAVKIDNKSNIFLPYFPGIKLNKNSCIFFTYQRKVLLKK